MVKFLHLSSKIIFTEIFVYKSEYFMTKWRYFVRGSFWIECLIEAKWRDLWEELFVWTALLRQNDVICDWSLLNGVLHWDKRRHLWEELNFVMECFIYFLPTLLQNYGGWWVVGLLALVKVVGGCDKGCASRSGVVIAWIPSNDASPLLYTPPCCVSMPMNVNGSGLTVLTVHTFVSFNAAQLNILQPII